MYVIFIIHMSWKGQVDGERKCGYYCECKCKCKGNGGMCECQCGDKGVGLNVCEGKDWVRGGESRAAQ